MDVFALRDRLVDDYRAYAESFMAIRDERIADHVRQDLDRGLLWPDPPLQLNPSFEHGGWIDDLVADGTLHADCARVFRIDKKQEVGSTGRPLRLHRHQTEAIRAARRGLNYVLTTGTGSGKSLSYIVPIVDHVLRAGAGDGRVKAIVVYPMNALANSQAGELEKFLSHGEPDGRPPVSFRRYTGQEPEEEREQIRQRPPDVLLTNYVMLEYLLTRPADRQLIESAQGLSFLVLDELHTYRGRQGADVALLVRRVREACRAPELRCVGTSATLAGAGSHAQQRAEVAQVATRLFGAPVEPEAIIGETLRRATPELDLDDADEHAALRGRIQAGGPPEDFERFRVDPLARWIEQALGVVFNQADGRLERRPPAPLRGEQGIAARLAADTGLDRDECERALAETLLAGSRVRSPEGFAVFAFRLHQFFSGGSTVSASLEPEAQRAISTSGQQFVPGSGRERVLLPLAFCRECGQEYFSVRERADGGGSLFEPREISDRATGEDERNGYLYFSTAPWPHGDEAELLDRVPAEWLEPDVRRIKRDRRPHLPAPVTVDALGRRSATGLPGVFVPAPFRFCLHCGVAYGARQIADFGKLASLGAGGRSTSTTVLGLSAVRQLRAETSLDPDARKLLSFSDNRQDASLQAGHFNDFVEIGLLRSGLQRAATNAGEAGLGHDELAQRVFDALALDPALYAADPLLKGGARRDTDATLREVLAYRLYRDQQRGWRLTSPNLEQTGLLRIDYADLQECCADEEVWQGHPALAGATAEDRDEVARTLLDFMRRELAIKVDALDQDAQERLRQRSDQRLRPPWALDEHERLVYAAVLYPRPRETGDERTAVFVSPRGGFGMYLRRANVLPAHGERLDLEATQELIGALLEALRRYGLVEEVVHADVPGYQLPAAQLRWHAADGTQAYHDPIRLPQAPKEGRRTNPFFVDLYSTIAQGGQGIEAREHTAQVPADERERRESRFRAGELPLLFCSPTMELGVDIASLNVVNLRNVPPTPASYAQRSGRAGRSGQPALVYTFCSTWNSHDQYFFRRPQRMVAGAVAPPQLDLANEDLVRAHVHAIWLAETGQSLKSSLTDLLDTDGDAPTLALRPNVRTAIEDPRARERARGRARGVLDAIGDDLDRADWYDEGWLDRVLDHAHERLDQACERWRTLYRSAREGIERQNQVLLDHMRRTDWNEARRLRREAEAQLDLLTAGAGHGQQSDFYSYRYFASEGFLPGYSFPRLPLSAFIPGRRGPRGSDDFLSRPRFLAISEFGPRSVVYHEGARYLVNRVLLPAEARDEEEGLRTTRAKLCERCGTLHVVEDGGGADVCTRCGAALPAPLTDLLRLHNVATRRRDRISSDEEERRRQGFELRTSLDLGERGRRTGEAAGTDGPLATLDYGHAARVWRINLGWARRARPEQVGFVLDTERGYWAKDERATADDPDDALSGARRRVVPFVEDRRNCLLVEPAAQLEPEQMASLQAALKRGIQAVFQLEDQELAAEPLPGADDRRVLLFYEAAEGGAGVLRRLLDDPAALGAVAREALDICHFDPDTGADRGGPEGASEPCEAACYDCLLSYGNQRDHRLLDRAQVREILVALAGATVAVAPGSAPPDEHLELLRGACDTQLERSFLDLVHRTRRRLPSHAQKLVTAAKCRPDFLYERDQIAVFVDGPVHGDDHQHARDEEATARLEDLGWHVVRLRDGEDWEAVLDGLPSVFGAPREALT